MIVKQFFGEVIAVEHGQVLAKCPNLSIGNLCWLHAGNGVVGKGMVVAVSTCRVSIAPIDDIKGLKVGDAVTSYGRPPSVRVGGVLLGKVVDPWGAPLRGGATGYPGRFGSFGEEQKVCEEVTSVQVQGGQLSHAETIKCDQILSQNKNPKDKHLRAVIGNLIQEYPSVGRQPDNGECPGNSLNSFREAEGSLFDSYRATDIEIHGRGPAPLDRELIRSQFSTGIKAIDIFCTLAKGQRIGIFAPAGVGKTSLLQMIINGAEADVIVVGLIGERGREVHEFVAHLKEVDKLKQTVIVASLSDDPPALRSLAAKSATAIAEHFRDKGLHVLLLIDSLTRVARAIREIAITSGEAPLRGGFPASVYSELPILLERVGAIKNGSITAFYTVLLPNKDEPDYLAEEIKSLIDAHILLSEEVCREGIRPSIDILHSLSRIFDKVNSQEHRERATEALRHLAIMRKNKLMLMLGGEVDQALKTSRDYEERIKCFLSQDIMESINLEQSRAMFKDLMNSS